MSGRSGRAAIAWWALAAALLVAQLGVSVAAQRRASRASRTNVLLPMFTVAGQDIDRELAAAGVYLEADVEGGGSDRFGQRVAQRLGRTAYLGPTISPGDLVQGVRHLQTRDVLPLTAAQDAEVERLIGELDRVRADLERSEREQRALVERLQCARIALIATLDEDQRRALAARAGAGVGAQPGGAPPGGGR